MFEWEKEGITFFFNVMKSKFNIKCNDKELRAERRTQPTDLRSLFFKVNTLSRTKCSSGSRNMSAVWNARLPAKRQSTKDSAPWTATSMPEQCWLKTIRQHRPCCCSSKKMEGSYFKKRKNTVWIQGTKTIKTINRSWKDKTSGKISRWLSW